MNKFSLRSFAVVAITALLLAILAVPVMAADEGSSSGSSAGATVSSEKSAPFAAYTKRRTRKVVRRKRRVVRRKRRVVRRKRRVVKRPVAVATAPTAPLAATITPTAPVASGADETVLAQTILDGLKARYPRYLSNVTVEFGNANGYQAISYYTIGRIVISPTHTATLQRILEHEIWHMIDWQDNNAMNWGEAIPPANMSVYAN